MPPIARNIALWVGILVSLLLIINLVQGGVSPEAGGNAQSLAYSDFLNKVESGEVSEVVIRESRETGMRIVGKLSGGQSFTTQGVNDPQLVENLRAHRVKLSAAPAGGGMDSFWGVFLSSWLPFLLLIAVYIFFMRQMQGKGGAGGGGGAMGFGKSRAKLLNENTEKKTFDDVAGIDEA